MFTVCYMATHMAKQLPATIDPTHLLQIYTSTKPTTTYLTLSKTRQQFPPLLLCCLCHTLKLRTPSPLQPVVLTLTQCN